jgi:hypothetical protein
MGHHLWEKVWYQHKVSAPSASSGITHQPSKYTLRASYAIHLSAWRGNSRKSKSTILQNTAPIEMEDGLSRPKCRHDHYCF